MSTLSDFSTPPEGPPDSPGSSVSTRLQDEYDELLKFAVVVPKYSPMDAPQTLTDAKESFQQMFTSRRGPIPTRETLITISKDRGRTLSQDDEEEVDTRSDLTPINIEVSQEESPVLPDFGGHSPISRDSEHRTEPKQSRYYSQRPEPSVVREKAASHSRAGNPDKSFEIGEYEKVYTATVDPDVSKMEVMMDQWCLDLKRNVLAEFSQSKIRIVETGRQQLLKEQERHASEKTSLLKEMDGLKELLHTYEKSIARKDQVISNLTNAMQKQKEKQEMLRKFSDWKIKHNDLRREAYSSNLARRHYQRQLSQKVWDSWHGVIETKWRSRIEKACQAKAQEVCVNLTNDYEDKCASLNEALEASRSEVARLHKERERYEEMMKKAFMRGVCALNLEAMSMFQGGEEEAEKQSVQNQRSSAQDELSDNLNGSLPEKDFGMPKSIPSDCGSSIGVSPREFTGPRVVTSQGAKPSSATSSIQSKPHTKAQTTKSASAKGKVISAKISAKVDTGTRHGIPAGGPLAPPMSSIIVERHQPVTKQTVSHAVAGKYPRPNSASTQGRTGISHRKIAGQGTLNITPNIQTVKVVD